MLIGGLAERYKDGSRDTLAGVSAELKEAIEAEIQRPQGKKEGGL